MDAEICKLTVSIPPFLPKNIFKIKYRKKVIKKYNIPIKLLKKCPIIYTES